MGKWAGRLFYNFGLQRRALTPCLYMPIPSVHLPRWAWVSHTQKEVTPWAQVLRAARAHSLAHLHIVCTMPHSAGGWAWERSPSRQLWPARGKSLSWRVCQHSHLNVYSPPALTVIYVLYFGLHFKFLSHAGARTWNKNWDTHSAAQWNFLGILGSSLQRFWVNGSTVTTRILKTFPGDSNADSSWEPGT